MLVKLRSLLTRLKPSQLTCVCGSLVMQVNDSHMIVISISFFFLSVTSCDYDSLNCHCPVVEVKNNFKIKGKYAFKCPKMTCKNVSIECNDHTFL